MSARPTLRWARRNRELVVAWEPVNRHALARLQQAREPQRTRSFAVHRSASTTLVVHNLSAGAIDNDVGTLIAQELVAPELLCGLGAFERCFAGVVESTGPAPRDCWRRFYRNTLCALQDDERATATVGGPIDTFRQIYRHAAALVQGASVLDAGSCFAFFPMLLAARGELRVTASDKNPATVTLGRSIAGELGLGLDFLTADVTRPLPVKDGSFDTVTALHLLEHLPEHQSAEMLASLCGAARRRVVVAVPLEPIPDPVYGHRQAFDLPRLASLGESLGESVPGWRGEAHEYLGGWLVLEPSRGKGAHRRGWLKHLLQARQQGTDGWTQSPPRVSGAGRPRQAHSRPGAHRNRK